MDLETLISKSARVYDSVTNAAGWTYYVVGDDDIKGRRTVKIVIDVAGHSPRWLNFQPGQLAKILPALERACEAER